MLTDHVGFSFDIGDRDHYVVHMASMWWACDEVSLSWNSAGCWIFCYCTTNFFVCSESISAYHGHQERLGIRGRGEQSDAPVNGGVLRTYSCARQARLGSDHVLVKQDPLADAFAREVQL